MANKFPTRQSFQRLNNIPLDETTVFDTLVQAQDYAKNNPTAYQGQVIHVKDARIKEEIENDISIYEKSCYIDYYNEIKPICNFSQEFIDLSYDIMKDIITGQIENTLEKIDNLKDLTYDNYTYDFDAFPDGDYRTRPWISENYSDKQISFKMAYEVPDDYLKNATTSISSTRQYSVESIAVERNGEMEYYQVVTFISYPYYLNFSGLTLIDEVIHMCDLRNVTTFENTFNGCLIKAIRDVTKWNVSSIENTASMFKGCYYLEELDLSNWDTSNITRTDRMFEGCTRLAKLNLENFITSKVENMEYMLASCRALTNLNLKGWDTSNVKIMNQLFLQCSSLKHLDVSGWDTSKVTTMREMFRGCSALTELDVSTWIRSIKTKDFYGMFANCVALVKLNAKGLIVSDTGISGTISILQMFRECQSLSQLDISDWTTSDIHEANFAFYHCESLTELDLSTWDVECLRYISHMFDGCKSLSLLNLSNWSEIYSFSEDYHVFTGCVSLELSNIIMENTAYYTVECITNAYNNS